LARVSDHRGRSTMALVCFAGLMFGMLVGGSAAGRVPGALRGVMRSSMSGTQKPLAAAAKKEESRFGHSVAISANGEFALIGVPGPQFGAGAAWVFKRSGSTWVEQGPPLMARGQGASHSFGESVAVSANGGIALVGAPREQGAGEAWVFKRSGSKWAQQGHALRTGKRLGEEVALSADGEIALVSATDHGTSSPESSSALVPAGRRPGNSRPASRVRRRRSAHTSRCRPAEKLRSSVAPAGLTARTRCGHSNAQAQNGCSRARSLRSARKTGAALAQALLFPLMALSRSSEDPLRAAGERHGPSSAQARPGPSGDARSRAPRKDRKRAVTSAPLSRSRPMAR
jgi:hypothetical protein